MRTATAVLSAIFVSGLCQEIDDNRDAKLRFYDRSLENYTEFPHQKAHHIFETTWYNSSRATVIFAHGFTGYPEGPAVTSVISTYLELNNSNVVLLNWQHLAANVRPTLVNSYLNYAVPNARKLGSSFANTLQRLQESGLDLNRTHLVGHSLGAQIFGIAGNNLKTRGIALPWITGLDPASTEFEGRALPLKLHAGSADFVDIIHSDPSKYGYRRSFGTVDFWPNYKNGAVWQPGCDSGPHPMFSPGDICNHNRCWQLLTDSLNNPNTIIGSYAKNFRMWKKYSNSERNSVTLALGEKKDNILPGNYYFLTNNEAPYGLGEKGL